MPDETGYYAKAGRIPGKRRRRLPRILPALGVSLVIGTR